MLFWLSIVFLGTHGVFDWIVMNELTPLNIITQLGNLDSSTYFTVEREDKTSWFIQWSFVSIENYQVRNEKKFGDFRSWFQFILEFLWWFILSRNLQYQFIATICSFSEQLEIDKSKSSYNICWVFVYHSATGFQLYYRLEVLADNFSTFSLTISYGSMAF